MNNVVISGRITKEPELHHTNTGTARCSFNIAVNRPQKDSNGKYIADFIPCTSWSNRAEYIANYVKKGNLLLINGSIQMNAYVDKNGANRVDFSILVDTVENITPKPQEEPNRTPAYNPPTQPQPQPQYNPEVSEDDLPW